MTAQALLSVEQLRVESAADEISYQVPVGGSIALIGEGASEAALAPLRLTPVMSGRILFAGNDLMSLGERQLRELRGNEIGGVFAGVAGSLHPTYRLGWQLSEVVLAHHRISKSAARDRAIDVLEAVGVSEAHRRVDAYPRELSVEMQLRTLIGIALINRPQLLIVDDPLAELDPVASSAIIELLRALRRRLGFALLLATANGELARELEAEPLTLY